MTTELEQEFYDTFGIESYTYYDCLDDYTLYDQPCNRENCISCGSYRKLLYKPCITAEKLLEMICIMRTYQLTEIYREVPSIDKLKEDILKWFISQSVINEKIKHQIQQLFKEDN